jgi:hypothetical protein
MTYTLTGHPDQIIRDKDRAFIPADSANMDYQQYLAWLEEGNQPNPAPAPPPPPPIDERRVAPPPRHTGQT